MPSFRDDFQFEMEPQNHLPLHNFSLVVIVDIVICVVSMMDIYNQSNNNNYSPVSIAF